MSDLQQPVIEQSTTTIVNEQPQQVSQPAVQEQPVGQPTIADNATVETTAAIQQTQMSSILDSLGEEYKQEKSLANFKDINDLAKSYLHAQQMIGKRFQEMSPEDVAVLNGLRGVPESSDKYELPEVVSPEVTDWYKGIAKDAGLTNDQAKRVMESYVAMEQQAQVKQAEQRKAEFIEAKAILKKEFGNGYDQQLKLAVNTAKAFAGADAAKLLDDPSFGNNPVMIKMLAKIGQEMKEDSIMEVDKDKVFGITPDRAKQQIDMRMKDPNFKAAYHSALHPNHKAAVDEMSNLFAVLNS
jgi:hypothetical protein